MKVKKAIEILKNLNFCERCANLGRCNCEEVKALRLAIEALEKQNKKQKGAKVRNAVKSESNEDFEENGDDTLYADCPNCQETVSSLWNASYCGDCGQRLDWEENL